MKKTIYSNAVSKEEIAKAVYENGHSTDNASVTLTFAQKDGTTWSKTYPTLAMDETCWCTRGWDRYGLKTYGKHYSWDNVVGINFNKYVKYKTITLQEVDPVTGKTVSETPLRVGVR